MSLALDIMATKYADCYSTTMSHKQIEGNFMNQHSKLVLNIAERLSCTEAEGPGKRYALWVQGCPLRCPGCCNPHMLAVKDATWLSVDELAQEICNTEEIEGVTFIGGEPFAQAEALAELAQIIRSQGLSVMVFSGFTYKYLQDSAHPAYQRLLANIDLLVDGPYIKSKHSTERRWIGSTNQNIRFLSDRYAHLKSEAAGWDSGTNTIELRLKGDQLFINGFPHPDLNALLNNPSLFNNLNSSHATQPATTSNSTKIGSSIEKFK